MDDGKAQSPTASDSSPSGRDGVPSPSACETCCDQIAKLCAAHGPVAPAGRFPVGTIFGDWRLTAFIGRGGSGEVYCAEHVSLGTSAAVKVLVRGEPRAKERFTREAKLLSELTSASFPKFYSHGEANGCAYIAMELLEPGDMPSGDKSVARFLLLVCDAVAELHARGIVHRDIKPGNILWRGGTPVLADLGLAKEIVPPGAEDQTLTLGGVGTPGYGAPEQMERGEASAASDIHALGVLADRCFDGNPPRAWARIIRRATSSIPVHRYPSVGELACAIRRRHWTGCVMLGLSVAIAAALSCALLRARAEAWWAELRDRWNAPVLDASAVLGGVEAKDVRWFLDDLPVDLPHAFVHRRRDLPDGTPRRLCAVAWRKGKTYSAKCTDVIPERWTGRRRLVLELAEDPPAGTIVQMYAQNGTPFEFAWCPPQNGAEAGPGFWIATRKLSERQFAAIGESNPQINVLHPLKAGADSDLPAALGFVGWETVPCVVLDGIDIRLEPPDFRQWRRAQGFYADQYDEMPEWAGVPRGPDDGLDGDGGWMRMAGTGNEPRVGNHEWVVDARTRPAHVRYMAISRFCQETNTVLYCTARSLLRSESPADAARGARLMKSLFQSADAALKMKAAEFCIERGLSALDDWGGTQAPVRLRLAAVRRGRPAELERLAIHDSDSDVRKAAYEALREPSPMVAARYIAQIRAEDDPGDIGRPLNDIGELRDFAALSYLSEHACMAIFRDAARARLGELNNAPSTTSD